MSGTDGVRSLKDINKENLEHILRSHCRRQDIKVSDDSNSELSQFEGNNDFYNSQIRKFSVKVSFQDQHTKQKNLIRCAIDSNRRRRGNAALDCQISADWIHAFHTEDFEAAFEGNCLVQIGIANPGCQVPHPGMLFSAVLS